MDFDLLSVFDWLFLRLFIQGSTDAMERPGDPK